MKAFFAKILNFIRSLGNTIAMFVKRKTKIHVSVDVDGDGESDSEIDVQI